MRTIKRSRTAGFTVALFTLAIATLAVASHRPLSASRVTGVYLYLDAADRPINVDATKSSHEATASERRLALHRVYCFFGKGGTARKPAAGSYCRFPEKLNGAELTTLMIDGNGSGLGAERQACSVRSAQCE